jgi:SAM-dependent methyltransferase
MKRLIDVSVPWAHVDPDENSPVGCLFCEGTAKTVGQILINEVIFGLQHCEEHATYWLSPQPGPRFLASLYSKEYYEADKHIPSVLQFGTKEIKDAEIERRINTARQVQELKAAGVFFGNKFLEIGSVKKDYVHRVVKEEGWDTTLLEVSRYGLNEALKEGIAVWPTPLLECPVLPSAEFDLATIYDFLEHTPNPRNVVKKISNSLKHGGYLVVRVPEINDLPTLHLVDHLWHFSRGALENLLQQEGFELIRSHESGTFPSPDSPQRMVHRTYYAKKAHDKFT